MEWTRKERVDFDVRSLKDQVKALCDDLNRLSWRLGEPHAPCSVCGKMGHTRDMRYEMVHSVTGALRESWRHVECSRSAKEA